ncbi:unnamed protein product, partial [Prorocentrum cordatum]
AEDRTVELAGVRGGGLGPVGEATARRNWVASCAAHISATPLPDETAGLFIGLAADQAEAERRRVAEEIREQARRRARSDRPQRPVRMRCLVVRDLESEAEQRLSEALTAKAFLSGAAPRPFRARLRPGSEVE